MSITLRPSVEFVVQAMHRLYVGKIALDKTIVMGKPHHSGQTVYLLFGNFLAKDYFRPEICDFAMGMPCRTNMQRFLFIHVKGSPVTHATKL